MKRLLALILVCALLVGCTPKSDTQGDVPTVNPPSNELNITPEEMPQFSGLGDAALLAYMEDAVYTGLVDALGSDGYFVENVSAVYISKEYLEEIAYNSQENLYFGYTLSELNAQFADTRYVFTLGEDGKTMVKAFEGYDTSHDQMLRNVAIGAGVILLCVTVAVVVGGATSYISTMITTSAKSPADMGLSSELFGRVISGIVTGVQTKDFSAALEAAVLSDSEDVKWEAVAGTLLEAAVESDTLVGEVLDGLSVTEAAAVQQQSGYPLDVIKLFETMQQYGVCKDAGLFPEMVNGCLALIRQIDLNYVDENNKTNLQRMLEGLAPLDEEGVPYKLLRIGAKMNATLAILSQNEHAQAGLQQIFHAITDDGEGANGLSAMFWIKLATILAGTQ